ncbi:carbamoyltransferase N-terminal domain-containing protein [Sphaerisporangium sp. B11E5]|uniref:carbamoyltransferase family protein n=1 Tax=Sphaerisporangium sp. B11E5 TaxID=3153563 RepID=UPI00325F20AF
MLTLGISAYYHDAAACLIRDGQIVGAVQEERFTRRKYDADLPVNAVRYCLDQAGATIADVDRLAFYEVPADKRERQKWQRARRTGAAPARPSADDTEMRLRDGLHWTGEIHFVPHHHAHAASAYHVSGFGDAAVLVCDAVGEWDTTSFWSGRGPELTRLGDVRFPHSLGLFYSCLTSYLGYRPNSDEYKVMGLASYGTPKYEPELRRLLAVDEAAGRFTLDTGVMDFLSEPEGYLRNLAELLGLPPRRHGEPVLAHHADVAASGQAVLESAVTSLLHWLSERQESANLCLAGGVALNCRANAVAFDRSRFTRLFVQPAAGDAGTALGAALCAEMSASPEPSVPPAMRHAYLGPRYDGDGITRMLSAACIRFEEFGDEAGLLEAVAAALAAGRTMGWFQGRMEFGPRALGARSILADPRTARMRDRLNADIKWREEFRPFAPAVLEERAQEFFSMDRTSPFMIDLFSVRRPDLLGAVTHVDGTARVQTVNASVAPRFHGLIRRFGELTGVPVLLNTSFNLSDEPIVCTPVDALRTFLRSSLDLLCLENVLVDAREIGEGLREAAREEHRFVAGAGLQTGREVYSFF